MINCPHRTNVIYYIYIPMIKTLAEEVLDIMPRNMADYNQGHQNKIDELLKLDNDDITIKQVNLAPRRRPESE